MVSSGRGRMASSRAPSAAEQPWVSPVAMGRGGIMDVPEDADGPRPGDHGLRRQMAKLRAAANVTQARYGARRPAASRLIRPKTTRVARMVAQSKTISPKARPGRRKAKKIPV